MPLPAEVMRSALILCLAGMALIGILYLRTRSMPTNETLKWGLLVLLLPLLGPFLTIVSQPGAPHHLGRRTTAAQEIRRVWEVLREQVSRRSPIPHNKQVRK